MGFLEVLVPYRNPEVTRTYHREYKRLQRAGSCQTPSQTLLPESFRVRTAQDVLELVAEQVHLVRTDSTASTLEKARTIGFLAGTGAGEAEPDVTGSE